MPSRNLLKEYAVDQFYHVYNRGVEKREIFLDEQDYIVFLGLLKKYLTGESPNNKNRHAFKSLSKDVQLLAYCLMPNHFHLLLYQSSENGITQLLRRISTGYVMYFNERYKRVGPLFQGTYKASHINSDVYLHHISRYIHLNPNDYSTWPYSSFLNYAGEKQTQWLTMGPVLELFDDDKQKYIAYVKDYIPTKEELALLKWQLANDPAEM